MVQTVKAKKYLGQHFLNDLSIAKKIVDALSDDNKNVLEVGPGMGVLTQFIIPRNGLNFKVVEIDAESVEYLNKKMPALRDGKIISADFLKMDLDSLFDGNFAVIGNFPYNISSQIFFKILEHKDRVPEVVGMLQREVAQRLASPPGKKDYGILSVLLQAYYDIEYLFTVDETAFTPPPKVKSGVIRLKRNRVTHLDCNEALFKTVIKTTFNQRRKTIWNSIRALSFDHEAVREHPFMKMRPEQLSVSQFVELTNIVAQNGNKQ